MIGYHCDKRLWSITDNRLFFRKQCQVCKQVFKQRKRQQGGQQMPKSDAFEIRFDGTRDLEVRLENQPHWTKVRATSETGNHLKESKTWHFGHEGKHYRIQLQVTE